MRLVEIPSYELKPGTPDEHDRLFHEEAAPLLRRFGIEVVAIGPSAGDPNGLLAHPCIRQHRRSDPAGRPVLRVARVA
jgi:hypothetical protein